MKTPIIRIKSKDDIDTSLISIYDMNNRYIDHNGNMYGLKFDYKTKKIKIIRILRTLGDKSYVIQRQILAKKLNPSSTIQEEAPEDKAEPVIDIQTFDPVATTNEILTIMESHKERFKGIMMNIKNANIFTKDTKEESVELDNIFRSIDLDGIQQIEKVEAYEKELTQYPRSITYYQAKLDDKARDAIEKMGNDNVQIMNFIHYYEISNSLTLLYTALRKMLSSLMDLVNQMEEVFAIKTNPFEIKSFEDGRVSITNTMIEIDEILEKLKSFEEYFKSPDKI